MRLKKIVAPSARELCVKELETQILSGRLAVGERLPAERELAERMGLSRNAVVAGLAELEAKGFVEVRARHGVYVIDYTRKGRIDTLVSIMGFNGGRFDRRTFDSLTAFRIHTEVECARLAALNRSEADLAELEAIHAAIAAGPGLERVCELMFDFHQVMFCATGNVIYPLMYNAFRNVSLAFTEAIFRHAGLQGAGEGHRELLDAIRDRDAAAAERVMSGLIARRVRELEAGYLGASETES